MITITVCRRTSDRMEEKEAELKAKEEKRK